MSIEFVNLGPDDYDRAKSILNKARHPGFVGRELFYRCATAGVCCVAVVDGLDCGVALVAKEKLQALSIVAVGQGKGVGSALMRRLRPRWVSAIQERVSFFERLGYKPFGPPKVGQNGKHATQLMERGEEPSAEEHSRPRDPGAISASKEQIAALSLPPNFNEMRAGDQKVSVIVGLMQSGKFVRGKTDKRLAELWGMTVESVQQYTAKAAQFHRVIGTSDERRNLVIRKLHEVLDNPDLSPLEMVAACRAMLEVDGRGQVGAKKEPTRVELSFEDQVTVLTRELREPGPELAEAMRRVGIVLPRGEVLDAEGEGSDEQA